MHRITSLKLVSEDVTSPFDMSKAELFHRASTSPYHRVRIADPNFHSPRDIATEFVLGIQWYAMSSLYATSPPYAMGPLYARHPLYEYATRPLHRADQALIHFDAG